MYQSNPKQRIAISRAALVIAVLVVLLLAGVTVMALSPITLAVRTSCGEGGDDNNY